MNNNFIPQNETDEQSQPVDKELTQNSHDAVTHKVVLTSPNLSSKDAGKWMRAWKFASNVYYPDLSELFDLYEYVIGMDNTLGGLLKKRRTAVLNKQLVYKNKAGEEVPEMKDFIKSKNFRALLAELLDARQYGRGGVEFVVGKKFKFKKIPRKHIKTKWKVISEHQSGKDGFDYTELWNVWVIDNGDFGDLLSCSLAACYKKDAVGDWAELIEGFGQPTQVIKFTGMDDQVLTELDEILEKAGSSRRIKIPIDFDYTQHENNGGNSTGDLQAKFIEVMNKEMAIKQAGSTETTGTSKGSGHAQATVHYQVTLEMIKEEMDYLIELLNEEQFHKVLKSYGIAVTEGGSFDFDKEVDIEYITKFKDIIKTGKELGLAIGSKFVYDTLAIPKPEAGDELLDIEDAVEVEEEDEKGKPPKPSKKRKPTKKEQPQNLSDSGFKRLLKSIKDFFGVALQRRGK